MLSRLERQRSLTENILEKIVDYENLKRAYEQVRKNGGSSGVDEMEIEELRTMVGKTPRTTTRITTHGNNIK